jgi:hypothetical protein
MSVICLVVILFYLVCFYSGDFVVRVKQWQNNAKNSSGQLRKRGEQKRTYEVIADHRCNSYNIEKVCLFAVGIACICFFRNTQSFLDLLYSCFIQF